MLRGFLLGSAYEKLKHDAGTKYADAVRFCFDRENSKSQEEWKYQRAVRENVLEPLQAILE